MSHVISLHSLHFVLSRYRFTHNPLLSVQKVKRSIRRWNVLEDDDDELFSQLNKLIAVV